MESFDHMFNELVTKHGEQNGGDEDFFVHNEHRIGCRYADCSIRLLDDGWHYGGSPEAYTTPAEAYSKARARLE